MRHQENTYFLILYIYSSPFSTDFYRGFLKTHFHHHLFSAFPMIYTISTHEFATSIYLPISARYDTPGKHLDALMLCDKMSRHIDFEKIPMKYLRNLLLCNKMSLHSDFLLNLYRKTGISYMVISWFSISSNTFMLLPVEMNEICSCIYSLYISLCFSYDFICISYSSVSVSVSFFTGNLWSFSDLNIVDVLYLLEGKS